MGKLLSSAQKFIITITFTQILILIHPLFLKSQCNELLWADEFNNSQLDTTKWNIEVNDDGGGNSELQYYTGRDENISITGGILKITARKETYQNREYTSGRINSKFKGDWRYGHIEARLKLPEGKGMWPAFWMLPTENKYGSWPNSGEIDIMEMVGGGTNDSIVWGTLHVGPPYNYSNGSYKLNEKFSEDFHVFAIDWGPDSIVWYIDGIQFSKKTSADMNQWLPFQERFFVILNLAVGGNWPGSPDETTQFPQTLEADYVRVYGNPAEQGIVAVNNAYRHSVTTYSFMDVPNATFHWSVNATGASIISDAESNTVQVQWGCDEGTVALDVTYPECGTVTYELPVTFSDFSINGVTEVLPNQSDIQFSVPYLASTTYHWVLPEGAQIVGETDTNSVWVKWGCVPGELGVSINNSCEFTAVSSTITFIEPVLTGSTTIPAFSENVMFSITDIPETTYNWSVPGDAVITSGQNTPQILVNFAEKGGELKVVFENPCGIDSLSILIQITDTLLLCDYESVFLSFVGWEDGVSPEVVENPLANDVNSSLHVGKSLKAASAWSGIYGDLGYNLNLKMHNRFSLAVRGPKAGKFLFKLEDAGSGIIDNLEDPAQTPSKEVAVQYTQPNEWQLLTFNFTGTTSKDYDRITLFYDFGVADTNTFYFDNIKLLPADTLLINQKNMTDIIEGSEDGKQILITLFYGQFVEELNDENWSFANLPEGVVVGNIYRQSNDSVFLTLQGNTTQDYDKNITNFTTTVHFAEVKGATYDLVAATGVKFKAITTDAVNESEKPFIQVWPTVVTSTCSITSAENIQKVEMFNQMGVCIYSNQNINNTQVVLTKEILKNKGIFHLVITTKSLKVTLKTIIIQ